MAEYAAALSDERARLARLHVEGLDVEAVLALSAAQLVREDRDIALRWEALSVMPAPFDRAGAAAVIDVTDEHDTHRVLSELVARALLIYEPVSEFYRMHDLMRPVAEGVLEPDPESGSRLRKAEARHAEHYLRVGSAADDRYQEGGAGVLEGLRAFDAAWPHLEVAWARMKGREDQRRWVSRFGDWMIYVISLRLAPRRLIPYLEAARAAARALGDRAAEGVHLGNLGLRHAALGEPRRAIEHYEQQLVIARDIGDRRGEGNHLGNLGSAYLTLGEPRRAIDYYEQALAIDREIGDRRGEGQDRGNLGSAYLTLGEPRRAIEAYEQALAIAREIGDRRGEGSHLGNLGLAYADLGEPRRAIELYEQALAIAREIGDRRGEGADLGNLGIAYAHLGELGRAIDFYEQALVIARAIEDRHRAATACWNMGLMLQDDDPARAADLMQLLVDFEREIGHPDAEKHAARVADLREGRQSSDLTGAVANLRAQSEAQRTLASCEAALELARQSGDRQQECAALHDLGDLSLEENARTAMEYYRQGLRIATSAGDLRGQIACQRGLASAHRRLRETMSATDRLDRALALAQRIGDRALECEVIWDLVPLLEDDNPDRAVELMEAAVAYEREIGHPNAEKDAAHLAAVRARIDREA